MAKITSHFLFSELPIVRIFCTEDLLIFLTNLEAFQNQLLLSPSGRNVLFVIQNEIQVADQFKLDNIDSYHSSFRQLRVSYFLRSYPQEKFPVNLILHCKSNMC